MTERQLSPQQTRARRRTLTATRADMFLDRATGGSLWRAYSLIGAGIFVVMGAFTVLSVV